MSIAAADPASKTAYIFTDTGKLAKAIEQYQFIPLRPDGAQMLVQMFEGGYLLDGAPINVHMGEGWFVGQQEVLTPYWDAGTVPRPSQDLLAVGVREMPEAVAENYAKFKAGEQGIFGDNKALILAGLGVGLFLLFSGKSRPPSSVREDYGF